MGTNRTLAYILMCGASLVVFNGCGHDYASLLPNQVRVFKIPVGDGGPGSDSTLCLLSVPAGYTPDHPFPLLVALHGGGSSAVAFHDLWRPVTQSNGYLLATPQGAEPGPDGIGYRWGPNAHDSVRRSIDVILRTVNVDPSAICLAGFSQGGHLTYALARSYPHVFAGIAVIGVGYDLPNATAAKAFHNMRMYIGHGELEPGLEDVRDFADSLRGEGCHVELAVYRGTGHGIPEPISSELECILRFLKEED
jgi:poly(3-hydroxybutyrate) depolymerase